MDATTLQQILAQQQAYFAQAQSYSRAVGMAARGYSTEAAQVIQPMGGPVPLPGEGAGLDPSTLPVGQRAAGAALSAGTAVGSGALAALAWGSMSMGMHQLGRSRAHQMLGVLDPFASALHGANRSFISHANKYAGINPHGWRDILPSLRGIHAARSTTGLLKSVGSIAARGLLGAAPALAIGAGAAHAIGAVGQGAGEWMQAGAGLNEVMPFTGIRGGASASMVSALDYSMSTMTDKGGDVGAQRSDMMGLLRTAGANREFSGVSDAKAFAGKFKTLMKETKAVATILEKNLSETYSMMRSMKGFGYKSSAAQGAAVASITYGARGTGIAAETVMSGMAAGMQMAPYMGMTRNQGADYGRRTTVGLASLYNKDSGLQDRLFEETGLQGEQAVHHMSQKLMGVGASISQSPVSQAITAAVLRSDGSIDETKLQRIMGGGMSGEALLKEAQTALKNKRIASTVSVKGAAVFSRMTKLAGTRGTAGILSKYSADIMGTDIDSATMTTTGMTGQSMNSLYDLEGKAGAAGQRDTLEAMGANLEKMQGDAIESMIDPRKIIGREWNLLKNKIDSRFKQFGKDLMHKATSFIEKKTASLHQNLVQHTSSLWNAGWKQAAAGGGTSSFMRGAIELGKYGMNMSTMGNSMGIESTAGMTGAGGMMAAPLFFTRDESTMLETRASVGGGHVTGIQLTPFQEDSSAGFLPGEARDMTRTLTGLSRPGMVENWDAGDYAMNAAAHPFGYKLATKHAIRGAGWLASKTGGAVTKGIAHFGFASPSSMIAGTGAAGFRGGLAGRAVAQGLRFGGALGTAARGVAATGAKVIPVIGWGVAAGMSGWDTYQYGRDINQKNAAIEKDAWYGYAAGSLGGTDPNMLLAPTQDLNKSLMGKLKTHDAGVGDYAGVFGASFISGFAPFDGFQKSLEDSFGVNRGNDLVKEVSLGGGKYRYLYGTEKAVTEAQSVMDDLKQGTAIGMADDPFFGAQGADDGAIGSMMRRLTYKAPRLQTSEDMAYADVEGQHKFFVANLKNGGRVMASDTQFAATTARATELAKAAYSSEAFSSFRKGYAAQSSGWTAQAKRDLAAGTMSDTLKAHISATPGGQGVLDKFKYAAAEGGAITGALQKMFGSGVSDIDRAIADPIMMKGLQASLGDLGNAEIDKALQDARYNDAMTGIESKLFLNQEAPDRERLRGSLRTFQEELSKAMGSGKITKEDLAAIGGGPGGAKLAATAKLTAYTSIGSSGLTGLMKDDPKADPYQWAVRWAATDMGRQGLENAVSYKTYAAEMSAGGAKMAKSFEGLGANNPLTRTMSTSSQYYSDVSGMSDKTVMESQLAHAGDLMSKYSTDMMSGFGAMTIGQQELAMKKLASDSTLNAAYGNSFRNIYSAQRMGVEADRLRKKKKREVGSERLDMVEGMLGISMGIDDVGLYGLGMKGSYVTDSTRANVEASIGAKYVGQDVTKYASMTTEFLRTGGGNSEKEIREYMAKMGEEKSRLDQNVKSPQVEETKINTAALEKLTKLLGGTDGGVFADLNKTLGTLTTQGIKVNWFGGGHKDEPDGAGKTTEVT